MRLRSHRPRPKPPLFLRVNKICAARVEAHRDGTYSFSRHRSGTRHPMAAFDLVPKMLALVPVRAELATALVLGQAQEALGLAQGWPALFSTHPLRDGLRDAGMELLHRVECS